MARASAPVSATAPRSHSRSVTRPASARSARVGGVAGRRARKTLLAQLVGYANRLVVGPTAAPADRPAVRYLESSRLNAVAPAPLRPADQAKLSYAQAELVVHVITAVLDGLALSAEDWDQGSEIAMRELQASTPEDWSPL
jgi:hypothetical protein